MLYPETTFSRFFLYMKCDESMFLKRNCCPRFIRSAPNFILPSYVSYLTIFFFDLVGSYPPN